MELRQDLPYNAEPVSIENEHFVGRIVIIVKPPGKAAAPGSWRYEPCFRGKQRCLELQVQGRFKQVPREEMQIRVSPKPLERMVMGLVVHSFAQVVLGVLRRLSTGSFSHSFGGGGEPPHMTFPISSICGLLVTPPGGTPPPLGTVELNRQHTGKAAWKTALPFDTIRTYTFTFHSMYLDIAQWQLVRVPGLRSLGLETFWGTATSMQVAAFSDRPGRPDVYWDLRLNRGPTGPAVLVRDGLLEDDGDRLSEASFVTCRSRAGTTFFESDWEDEGSAVGRRRSRRGAAPQRSRCALGRRLAVLALYLGLAACAYAGLRRLPLPVDLDLPPLPLPALPGLWSSQEPRRRGRGRLLRRVGGQTRRGRLRHDGE